MEFDVTPEAAAAKLDRELRKYPWFLSVGIGITASGPTLFVYTKTRRHRKLPELSRKWMGYPIIERAIGAIKPINSKQIGAILTEVY